MCCNQKYSKILLKYFYQKVKYESNQASSSNYQFIGNSENRFELVKRHHGYAIDKIKNVRNFTEPMIWFL